MGLARLYLALCVVAAHAGSFLPFQMHGGTEAVQIFFMISGFYMALIANKYATFREFITSRFLRIFIPYYAVCIAIIVVSCVAGLTTGKWLQLERYHSWSIDQNSVAGLALAVLANVFIFGSDWILYISAEPHESLQFTANFHELPNPLARYLLIPPAWSIGVELTFYLLVPFLNRLSNGWLLGCLFVSILMRVFAYEWLGMTWDPWSYRFMPFELALFLSGMLACRMYNSLATKQIVAPRFESIRQKLTRSLELLSKTPLAVQFLAGILVFWSLNELITLLSNVMPVHYSRLVTYVLWVCLLPLLFFVTCKNKTDRFLGELSYPLYLCHYFIVGLVGAVYTRVSIPVWTKGPLVCVLSLIAALLLLKILVIPLEARRHTIAKRLVKGTA